MSETTNTVTTPKTEVKPTATKAQVKSASPKTVVKPAAAKAEVVTKSVGKTKVAAPKKKEISSSKSDATLTGIAEDQYDSTAETIINALTALDQQLKDARSTGSDRAKEIVKEFGGENKFTDLISKLAGYMGEATGAGMVAGMSPMIIMAGTAKGVYKKITD